MKTVLKNMFISLLTGSCLAVGFILVMLATDYVDLATDDEDDSWVDVPNDVSIANDSLKANQDRFTVIGEIRNDAPHGWKSVWVNANVFLDSALINRCFEIVADIPKKSTVAFEVTCDWTTGTDLPDSVRYTLQVTNGVRGD